MTNQVLEIPPVGLALAFLPVLAVVVVLMRWSLGPGRVGYALARMLLQLLAIGYVLNFLFAAEQSWIIGAVLAVMLLAASWIALRPVNGLNPGSYARALFAIAAGSLPVLLLVTQFVIGVEPWFSRST